MQVFLEETFLLCSTKMALKVPHWNYLESDISTYEIRWIKRKFYSLKIATTDWTSIKV